MRESCSIIEAIKNTNVSVGRNILMKQFKGSFIGEDKCRESIDKMDSREDTIALEA